MAWARIRARLDHRELSPTLLAHVERLHLRKWAHIMYDAANLICRALLSAVLIVLGYLEFVDVTRITNNPGTKRFVQLLTGGVEAAA